MAVEGCHACGVDVVTPHGDNAVDTPVTHDGAATGAMGDAVDSGNAQVALLVTFVKHEALCVDLLQPGGEPLPADDAQFVVRFGIIIGQRQWASQARNGIDGYVIAMLVVTGQLSWNPLVKLQWVPVTAVAQVVSLLLIDHMTCRDEIVVDTEGSAGK